MVAFRIVYTDPLGLFLFFLTSRIVSVHCSTIENIHKWIEWIQCYYLIFHLSKVVIKIIDNKSWNSITCNMNINTTSVNLIYNQISSLIDITVNSNVFLFRTIQGLHALIAKVRCCEKVNRECKLCFERNSYSFGILIW